MKLFRFLASIFLLIGLANPAFAASNTVARAIPGADANTASTAVPTPPPEFPVILGNVEIFRVASSPMASVSPADRATLISKNIREYADGKSDAGQLKLLPQLSGIGIGDDKTTLMVITEKDALHLGKAQEQLAGEVLAGTQAAISSYRSGQALKVYGLGSGLTLISLIGLWFALKLNNRAHAWLVAYTNALQRKHKGSLQLKGVELLSPRQIRRLLRMLVNAIRVFVMLLCWYFFLPLILSFFPETRKVGAQIFDYLLTPFATIFHTVVDYIPNLFYILVICIIAYYILKFLSYIFILLEEGELKFDWFYDDWARPTYQIIRFLVIVSALISAYPYIPGSSSEAFQGVGLVLGAIISFASSSAISNIVAGIILTYTRAFRLGDRIKIGDAIGDVVEKTLLVTRIKTIKHVIVTVPNSIVMGAHIINFSTSAVEGAGVILHTSITIGYDVPWQKVHGLLVDAALSTEKILAEPRPFVLQTSLDDWYVSYEINAYTRQPENMADIYSELHQHILEKFDADGVEIMSPHYFAVRDGNTTTVPSVLQSENYAAPAFAVRPIRGDNNAF